jgi:hypothetical protein
MYVVYFLLVLVGSEALLAFFYYLITPVSIRVSTIIDYRSLAKGIIERIFLTVALINDYPHALTLFGTLKLATRLKRDADSDKNKESLYNDFYLLGNFISIIASIFYVFVYGKLVD